MFGKKKCKCGKSVSRDFAYCPYCGRILDSAVRARKAGNSGGLIDEIEEPEKERQDEFGFENMKLPFGFNTLFRSLVKQIDRQFKEFEIEERKGREKPKKVTSGGISISIGPMRTFDLGSGLPRAGSRRKVKAKSSVSRPKLTKEQLSRMRKAAKLPKTEPQASVRRLSGGVVYEIDLPGVESVKDVVINKIQNAIEIKAFARDKVYFKIIPLDLDMAGYRLKDGKLFLEFRE